MSIELPGKSAATLYIFSPKQYWALSPNTLVSQLPFKSDVFDTLAPDKTLIKQIPIQIDTAYNIDDNHTAYISASESKYYSLTNIQLLRVGNMSGDHIQLENTLASFTLKDNMLHIIDDTGVYFNGRKVDAADYLTKNGDCIWAGLTQITLHDGHIECCGNDYTPKLNIATQNPDRYEEYPIYKRSPRIVKREPTDSVELSAPPNKEEKKKNALIRLIIPPLISAAMMIGFGILMGRGIMMMLSAGMMVVTMVNSTFTFISDQKTRKEKEKNREDNYTNYLLSKRKELKKLNDMQRESLLYHNLTPIEIEREIRTNSSRIYERASGDSDFLTLSLGFSDIPISYKVKTPGNVESSHDTLTDEMQSVAELHHILESMPTVIDLKNGHLGLVSEKPYIHHQLTCILAQLCFYHSYHDIEIVFLTEDEYRQSFEWIRWYPHCRVKTINVAGLISAENHRDQVLGNIAQVLKQRQQKTEESKQDSRFLPHYIFIVDNPKLLVNHSIMEYLQTSDATLGFSLIYTTNIQANLPDNIKTVFRLDGGMNGTLVLNEGNLIQKPVKLLSLDGINLEHMARRLAPIRHLQGISTQIPESVSFFELYNVKSPYEVPVLELWQNNVCYKSLAVPLGLRGKDDIVTLNLHENAHGPHGLVAGTTGSGKSEIVQSYILSLAINFHPHEVGFLLIDYKGGGMANLFANLPHLLGTITNLDGSESIRALTSIKSELARRQKIFNEHDVNNINQYTKLFRTGEVTLPLPHLFIISDEFAELKKEQPEFMAELVSTARIGRSLGVHLILATQKPSGVVDDQIWSNSKFKLALKVANESDSNEVLKTPDAARITQPGRAYLQVGNNEIYELFQSAWSGAPYVEDTVERGFDSRVYVINQLGQGVLLNEDLSIVDKTKDAKHTELDVTVEYIKALYDNLNAAYVERPWLPPLEQKIATSAIYTGHDVGKLEEYNLNVPLGIADIPEQQKQEEFMQKFFDDGNLAIFGASGFGKSTAIMLIALTLATHNSPRNCIFYIFDYGSAAISQLRGLPHTAEYLAIDDVEKLDKLIKHIADEIKQRKTLFAAENALNFRMYNDIAKNKLPAAFLFIDNFDVVREVRDDLEDSFKVFTRDGPSVGIYTVITATRLHSVKYSIISNFKNKIAQYMTDKTEYASIVGRSSYELPEIRGRALVKLSEVHASQLYLPIQHENDIDYAKDIGKTISEIAEKNTAGKAEGVRMLPNVITFSDIKEHFNASKRNAIIGFNTETTEPSGLDLTIPFQLIIGSALSGKTNILRILLCQFTKNLIFVSDSGTQDLADFSDKENIAYINSGSQIDYFADRFRAEVMRLETKRKESKQNPRDFIISEPPTLVLIDDGDSFIEYTKAKATEMEALMKKASELGVCFIATTLNNRLKGYDPISVMFKNPQGAVLLGNPDGFLSVVNIRIPRGYKSSPELAFLYKRGDTEQIKLPFVD